MRAALIYVWCWLRSRHALAAVVLQVHHSAKALEKELIELADVLEQNRDLTAEIVADRDELLGMVEELRADNARLMQQWWEKS